MVCRIGERDDGEEAVDQQRRSELKDNESDRYSLRQKQERDHGRKIQNNEEFTYLCTLTRTQ